MAVFRYQKYKQQKKKYINLTLLKLKTCTSKDITEKVKKQPWLAGSVGASSCTSKCCRFNSWSGHIPWLLVQSQLGCIQEATDWCFSLTSMFLSLYFFLSLKINKYILRQGLKKGKWKDNKQKGRKYLKIFYLPRDLYAACIKKSLNSTIKK